jgi:predicted SprT family Zn-dependent metalloprotease
LKQQAWRADLHSGDIYGATFLPTHLTLLRGSSFDQVQPDPELVIAHELAHIYLHSEDEVEVDHASREWVETIRATERKLEAIR